MVYCTDVVDIRARLADEKCTHFVTYLLNWYQGHTQFYNATEYATQIYILQLIVKEMRCKKVGT